MTDDFLSWARSVLFDPRGLGQSDQVLVLTPTDGPAGIYTDDDGDDYVVVKFQGEFYAMSWYRDVSEIRQSDLPHGTYTFTGAYIKSATWDFGDCGSVFVQDIGLE